MGKVVSLISRGLYRRTSNIHAAIYRRTRGRVGGKVGAMPTLLLTTTGRKSGQPRTVPLNYIPLGSSYAVIASNSGKAQPPMWWLNLQANPQATLEVGGTTVQVIARQATHEEQAKLWPKLISNAYNYEEYRKRTARHIPIVILSPVQNGVVGD